MTPELEKLIKETLLCIEGITLSSDDLLDEKKINSPICNIYKLVHGLVCKLNISGCCDVCVHGKNLGENLKTYKEALKTLNIIDIDKIIKNLD